jgi:tetratricopeptide (TPR) repeat protein
LWKRMGALLFKRVTVCCLLLGLFSSCCAAEKLNWNYRLPFEYMLLAAKFVVVGHVEKRMAVRDGSVCLVKCEEVLKGRKRQRKLLVRTPFVGTFHQAMKAGERWLLCLKDCAPDYAFYRLRLGKSFPRVPYMSIVDRGKAQLKISQVKGADYIEKWFSCSEVWGDWEERPVYRPMPWSEIRALAVDSINNGEERARAQATKKGWYGFRQKNNEYYDYKIRRQDAAGFAELLEKTPLADIRLSFLKTRWQWEKRRGQARYSSTAFEIGQCLETMGKPQEAVDYYRQSIQRGSSQRDCEASLALARLLIGMGRFSSVERLLGKWLRAPVAGDILSRQLSGVEDSAIGARTHTQAVYLSALLAKAIGKENKYRRILKGLANREFGKSDVWETQVLAAAGLVPKSGQARADTKSAEFAACVKKISDYLKAENIVNRHNIEIDQLTRLVEFAGKYKDPVLCSVLYRAIFSHLRRAKGRKSVEVADWLCLYADFHEKHRVTKVRTSWLGLKLDQVEKMRQQADVIYELVEQRARERERLSEVAAAARKSALAKPAVPGVCCFPCPQMSYNAYGADLVVIGKITKSLGDNKCGLCVVDVEKVLKGNKKLRQVIYRRHAFNRLTPRDKGEKVGQRWLLCLNEVKRDFAYYRFQMGKKNPRAPYTEIASNFEDRVRIVKVGGKDIVKDWAKVIRRSLPRETRFNVDDTPYGLDHVENCFVTSIKNRPAALAEILDAGRKMMKKVLPPTEKELLEYQRAIVKHYEGLTKTPLAREGIKLLKVLLDLQKKVKAAKVHTELLYSSIIYRYLRLKQYKDAKEWSEKYLLYAMKEKSPADTRHASLLMVRTYIALKKYDEALKAAKAYASVIGGEEHYFGPEEARVNSLYFRALINEKLGGKRKSKILRNNLLDKALSGRRLTALYLCAGADMLKGEDIGRTQTQTFKKVMTLFNRFYKDTFNQRGTAPTEFARLAELEEWCRIYEQFHTLAIIYQLTLRQFRSAGEKYRVHLADTLDILAGYMEEKAKTAKAEQWIKGDVGRAVKAWRQESDKLRK